MSLDKKQKINQLLHQWSRNTIYLTFWLNEKGYSSQLLNRYKKSNWIAGIGNGAVVRTGDKVTILGALFAIQQQGKQHIYPGGKTALRLLGKAHCLEFSTTNYTLFAFDHEKLPAWFQKYNWGVNLNYYRTSFLPADIGLIDQEMNGFSIKISSAARALLEWLYLAPKKQDLHECYQLMEGLNNLRPKQVQQLLEACTSVKVKRLFLYMAEKAEHQWFNFLAVDKIDLGNGKRQLAKNGSYIPKYKITVPKMFESGEL